MPLFIGGLPAQGSPVNSADVRNNFLALNARTDKLTTTATVPSSTSIVVGSGTVFFSDRVQVDFAGQLLDLGDLVTGVLPFDSHNIGFFKDIVVALRVSFNNNTDRYEAKAVFVEGPQKSTQAPEPDLVQLRSTDLPVASFVVRHNGLLNSFRGQIEPIEQSVISDLRNFIDAGGQTYYSATVGDRQVESDGYGTVVLDGYGNAIISGSTIGTFTGLLPDGYGGFVHPIQQAINYVSSLGGGTVFLRRGTYTPNTTLLMPGNVELLGEGSSTMLVRLDTFTGPLIRVAGNKSSISNLFIQGPATHVHAFGTLVEFNAAGHCAMKGCNIDAAGVTGVTFQNVSSRCIFANNFIDNADTAVFISSDSSKILVTANQFNNYNTEVQNNSIDSLVESNIA